MSVSEQSWGFVIVAIFARAFKGVSTPHRVGLLISLLSLTYPPLGRVSVADVPQPTPVAPAIPSTALASNLDGVYLFLGVGGGALRVESEWDSTVGAHGALFSYSEGATLSLLGVDLGLSQYGDRAGGRAWVAPTAATRALGPLVGLSVGVSAEWDRTDPPKWGAAATIFAFAGVTPTVTIGRHERVGTFVEVGLRLSFPALRFSRRGILSD